ncbi:MAG: C40 family peptidase [Candidatus Eremiobacteraeota bacterium]|nr:C40 family peptidase [Candidatus Eremiobacteraeota bacterium]
MTLFLGKKHLIAFALVASLSLPALAGDHPETEALVPPPQGWPKHRVESGQTLWRISKGYGIPVDELMQANNLSGTTLMPGDVLYLPRQVKPEWSPPPERVEPVREVTADMESVETPKPPRTVEQPRALGEWVEVTLPDSTKAWVRAENLVLGSWQPCDREYLVATARAFIGVPYKWGGTNPNGYDCSGFVQEVFRLSGHSVPRMADAQYEKLEKVDRAELILGDLVFFNTDGSGVSHVGIYSGDGKFLHASSSRGVIESGLEESYYASRYVGASRAESLPVLTSSDF